MGGGVSQGKCHSPEGYTFIISEAMNFWSEVENRIVVSVGWRIPYIMLQVANGSSCLSNSTASLSYFNNFIMEDSARHAPRQSNLLNHLVESHVGTSRNAIKFDLIDKIVYDDLPVLKRLRIDQVDDNFVTTCATSLEAEYMDDIILLKILAEQASKKAPEVLEFEEVNDKASDPNTEQKSGNHGSVEEKKMYDPLVHNIRYVSLFFAQIFRVHRCACSVI